MSSLELSQPSASTVELARLVDRITFGVDRTHQEIAESLGYEAYLEWQLDDEAIDDSDLEAALQSFLPTLTMSAEELGEYIFEQENFGSALRDLTIATMIRQVYSPRQLFERMVEFWSDHFNAPALSEVAAFFKLLEDRDMMRHRAMGRFGDLLEADAKSPAMLYYLDNYTNTADGPNENYARELLELHTLGVDGGYTEEDIKETARIFTGWTIRQPADFYFSPLAHDSGSKSAFGRAFEPAGIAEGEALLALLASSEATARHVVTKMARRFSADLPSRALVDAGVEAWIDSDGDIRVVLRTLFLHPELRQQGALKLKRPNEFSAGLLRGLEAELQGNALTAFFESLDTAGQRPFAWPAPDGYPDRREYWQSTIGFQMRFNAAFAWTREFAEQSAVLQEAAQIDDLLEQAGFLAAALRPRGLGYDEMRRLLHHGHQVSGAERPAALAAWLMATPEGQWR
ncbi:MAG: DUF1800 family protein [Gammaproteobacteria bacterium]|jgi:uncharacterized protein (DUF1800 family)|nr:DUF1800 family protein [Gammaproteobacteria bacterium]